MDSKPLMDRESLLCCCRMHPNARSGSSRKMMVYAKTKDPETELAVAVRREMRIPKPDARLLCC